MDNNDLASIFYIIVHDYDDIVLKDSISQQKDGCDTYRQNIRNINDWSVLNEYGVIERHSKKLLDRMNSEGV